MSGKSLILPLAFLLLASFHPGVPGDPRNPDNHNPGDPPARILQLYHKADQLFHLSTSTGDSTALAGFIQVIAELDHYPGLAGRDTLLLQSWLKKGVLLDARSDYTGAREAYLTALSLHRSARDDKSRNGGASAGAAGYGARAGQNDSLSFVIQVYTGSCYYNLNNFDSASYFLLRAESLTGKVHDPDDEVRLYNTLGVLYYDNGNYRQGKNYFSKALGIVQGRKPFDTLSAVSLETNIATSFYRLGLYRESLALYGKILQYHLFANQIYTNMGRAYAALDKYPEAMACFRKVTAARVPAVFNEMAFTQLRLGRMDSSAYFLDRLQSGKNSDKTAVSFQPNGLDIGINELYRAELLATQKQYMAALASLQKAIIIFSRHFSNPDIYTNPADIMGTFAYYRLFDALFKKAKIFGELYRTDPKKEYLLAAYEAYKTSLSILHYIEKSYDTDDAKLFLKKKSAEVYQGALSTSLELYHRFPADGYLEQAFLISEKNKASIITAGLKERTFHAGMEMEHAAGAGDSVGARERNIKYNIARLNVRSDEAQDSKETENIAREKAGYEIELARLQKELEQNARYYKLKYDDSSPGVKELQQHLDGKQALISFYTTAEALHIFIVTRSSFAYARVDSLEALQQDLGDWLNRLKSAESGKKFKGEATGDRLYKRLVRPIQAIIPGQDEWIIVPDGLLYFLPFESLPAAGAHAGEDPGTLLETTTISYLFSSRFMVNDGAAGENHVPAGILSFAPFASQGSGPGVQAPGAAGPGPGVAGPGSVAFSRLPASRDEIAGLVGMQCIDSAATKERFLAEMNKYPVVHLATHAVSSVNNVSESFVAFYPQAGPAPPENRLFLEELYGLDMSKTRLVIISACETGQGELVSNEGVISLARAFTYAGCGSTINSLWKADDKATSFILRQFHVYLQKGFTKSKALQRAKLDYLKSDAINKSPAYWSHLILIGDTGPVYPSSFPYKWAVLVGIFFCLIIFGVIKGMRTIRIGQQKKKKKSTSFTDPGF
jgi:CHAT domain-containing protein